VEKMRTAKWRNFGVRIALALIHHGSSEVKRWSDQFGPGLC
jgi:hypothetical protein